MEDKDLKEKHQEYAMMLNYHYELHKYLMKKVEDGVFDKIAETIQQGSDVSKEDIGLMALLKYDYEVYENLKNRGAF
jgi:phage terminase small subunit